MNDRKNVRVRTICSNIKRIVNYTAIIGIFYILLYQIEALRKLCKGICEYVIDWFLPVELSDIKTLYFCAEKGFKIVIVLSVFFGVLSMLVRNIRERRLKNKTGETRFETSLFRYLHDTTVPRCFLVTGQWGSGKSYEIKQFFDKYYYNTKTKVYRVSCFGLSSRKELIDEINSIVEQGDSSFYAQIIKVLQYLPVIGDAINKFLKKSYGYDSIEEGTVFVFEDFERITSRPVTESRVGSLYGKLSSFQHIKQGGSSEIRAVKNELEAIGRTFESVRDSINRYSLSAEYDKYIAISGFINELIEVYGMKVIVVCNTDVLGEKFVYDVLRSKLNCLEYKKITTPETRASIIQYVLESKTFDDEEKQKRIEQYLILFKENIDSLKLDDRFKDMRLFGGLLDAFIDTAKLFDKEVLTRDFLNSLMNSIMIMHLEYYRNSFKHLNAYVNGANIAFLIRLFGRPTDTEKLVRLPGCDENIRWIDESVSGYWISNLSVPKDICEIVDSWNNYVYSDLEHQMLSKPSCLIEKEEYDLMHVFFFQKESDLGMNNEERCKRYIRSVLSGKDLSTIDAIDSILGVYHLCDNNVNEKFIKNLFEALQIETQKGDDKVRTYIQNEYSRFLQKDK